MIQPPPRSTRTHPLFPHTPLFRSRQSPSALACGRYAPRHARARPHTSRPSPPFRRHVQAHMSSFEILAQSDRCINLADCVLRRSEEHTSELQSLMRISYAVFCLKKKKKKQTTNITKQRMHQI